MSNSNIELAIYLEGLMSVSNAKYQSDLKWKKLEAYLIERYQDSDAVVRIPDENDPTKYIDVLELKKVTPTMIKDFFGHICKKQKTNGAYFEPIVYQSYQHVNGYNSALKDMCRQQRVDLDIETQNTLSDFLKGYKRILAEQKQLGLISCTTEGKQPLFPSAVWSKGTVDQVADKVYTECMSNHNSGMQATGVPLHLTSVAVLNQILEVCNNMKSDIGRRFDELPTVLSTTMRNDFIIKSAAANVTKQEFNELVGRLTQSLTEMEHRITSRGTLKVDNGGSRDMDQTGIVTHPVYEWGNRLHIFPQDFEFPNVDCGMMWGLWWNGNKDKGYPAYRHLKAQDVARVKGASCRLTKTKMIMNYLVQLSEKSSEEIEVMSESQRSELFGAAFQKMCAELYSNPQIQAGGRSCVTLYERLCRKNKQGL